MKRSRADVLIVAALPDELGNIPSQYPCLFTGIGKVHATLKLTEYLAKHAKENTFVLNLGSAGSPTLPTGSLVEAVAFIQHDMDVTGLGFPLGETPFDSFPALLEIEPQLGLPVASCATGDQFVQSSLPINVDLIDMEAYALAKVCRYFGVTFACVKHVTDGADDTAHDDWRTNVKTVSTRFEQLLELHLQ